MSSPPYMKLFWGDYHKATRHLRRAAEHGAYFLLIGALWDAGGRLPCDDAILADYALCTAREWEAMKPKLMPFFRVVRGHLTHSRVTEELAKYDDKICKLKAAGKSGGKARARNQSENSQANAKQKPTYSDSESESERSPLEPPVGGKLEGDDFDLGGEPPARTRRKAARPIPDPFPTAELIAEQQAKAREAGADLDVGYQAERFRNWALGRDARYADWTATWRNWVAKAIREAPKKFSGTVAARPSAASEAEVWRRRVIDYKKDRWWQTLDWGEAPGRPGCQVPPEILAEFGFTADLLPFPGRGAA